MTVQASVHSRIKLTTGRLLGKSFMVLGQKYSKARVTPKLGLI
jgi:hypothetical protein